MAGIVTSESFRRAVLTWISPFLGVYRVRLFTNDYIPLPNSQPNDFDEPQGSWYSSQLLNDWNPPANLPGGKAEIVEELHTWTAGGILFAESVWGYWVTNQDGLYVWAERVPGLTPLPMNANGKEVKFIPRLQCGALC